VPYAERVTHCCVLHATRRLGAHYDIEGVADSAVLVLAKFTTTLNPSIPKPRVAFGRDPKACAAVETMLLMVNRCVAVTNPGLQTLSLHRPIRIRARRNLCLDRMRLHRLNCFRGKHCDCTA
jgi:hypothetical protein